MHMRMRNTPTAQKYVSKDIFKLVDVGQIRYLILIVHGHTFTHTINCLCIKDS